MDNGIKAHGFSKLSIKIGYILLKHPMQGKLKVNVIVKFIKCNLLDRYDLRVALIALDALTFTHPKN